MFRSLLAVVITLSAVAAAGWFAMHRADIPYETLETAYKTDESQFLTLENGVKLHVRDEGNLDAPAIVLLHGFASSLHIWENWAEHLKKDFRVISIDLPGHGLSRSSEDPDVVSVKGFIAAINGVADELGADTFSLAGHSLGGHAAWVYATEHPDRVDGLILVDAGGWPVAEGETEKQPLLIHLLGNKYSRRLLGQLDMTSLIRVSLKDSFVDENLVTDEMVSRYASFARGPGHRDALFNLIDRRGTGRYVATAEQLAKITAPTLILWGTLDTVEPVQDAQKFANAITGASVKRYAGVGHLPQLEAPKESAADVKAFLIEQVYTLEQSQADELLAAGGASAQ